jgi:type 1 glutamine amidotransferase
LNERFNNPALSLEPWHEKGNTMNNTRRISRRAGLKAGLTILTASTLSPNPLHAQKAPGEVRVIVLAGDYWHNGEMYELHWRSVLRPTGWRILFAQSSRFVTPEALSLADLFIVCRYAGGDSRWSPDGMVENRPYNSPWMTAEQEQAIVDNVTKRGMGLLPLHCSLWNPNQKQFMQLIGVKEPKMHGHMVMTSFYGMNQDHPITRGVEPFEAVDEIFGADLDDTVVPLFRAKQSPELLAKELDYIQLVFYPDQKKDKSAFPLDRVAGWVREAGKGRVVVLNFLSHQQVFWKKSTKEIIWRSAHWAMKKDIHESGLIEGRSKDRV